MVLTIIGAILILISAFFLFLGAFGIYRLPDIYNRLQAATKATTLGAFIGIIGVGFLKPEWFLKTFVIASFIFLTNPLSSHAIGRSSCLRGIKPYPGTVVDKTVEFKECKSTKEEQS